MSRAKALLADRRVYLTLVIVASLAVSFGVSYFLTMRIRPSVGHATCQNGMQCVGLYSDAAEPSAITVAVGQTVQFNSADGKKHNLAIGGEGTQGHGSHSQATLEEFQSGDFGGDEAWQATFSKTGTYDFRDKYNDRIKATVIVYQPGADTTIKR